MSARQPRPSIGQHWERPRRRDGRATRLRVVEVLPRGMLRVQYRQVSRKGLSYWGKVIEVTALLLLEEYQLAPAPMQKLANGMTVGAP